MCAEALCCCALQKLAEMMSHSGHALGCCAAAGNGPPTCMWMRPVDVAMVRLRLLLMPRCGCGSGSGLAVVAAVAVVAVALVAALWLWLWLHWLSQYIAGIEMQ